MSPPERDPHLRAALRHAPDRELQPPPELDARILAAAHRALQAQGANSRPAAASGGSWRARLEALLRRPAFGAALASVVLVSVIGSLLRFENDDPSPPVAALGGAGDRPAPAAPAAPAAIAVPPPARPAEKAQLEAAPRAELERRATAHLRESAAADAADAGPIAALRSALAGSGGFPWRLGSSAPQAHGAAAERWLAQVQRLTRGRWQQAEGASPPAAGDPVLSLTLPGEAGGRFTLQPQALRWQPAAPGQPAWIAPLPAAQVQQLRRELEAWAASPGR